MLYVHEFVQRAVLKIAKGVEEEGFFFFGRRITIELKWDYESALKILDSFTVNPQTVLRYLKIKYIPTRIPNGAAFVGQSCIQKVIISPNGKLFIHIKNSEAHKIITDTIHALNVMEKYGYDMSKHSTIVYKIEFLKASKQDIPMYIECLKEWNMPVNNYLRRLQKMLLLQARGIDGIMRITMLSIRKKWLRYYHKIGLIDEKEKAALAKMTMTNRAAIMMITKPYKERAKEMGLGRI